MQGEVILAGSKYRHKQSF